LKSANERAYDDAMARLGRVFFLGAALAALGCDGAGGLLVATPVDAGAPVVLGPSVTSFVSAGTVAKSSQYTVVYTLGQATPEQGVSTSAKHIDNGGLVGAMNGTPASADAP
jgi:hypothetical protein